MAINEQLAAIQLVTRATERPLASPLPDAVVQTVGKYSARAEWELRADRYPGAPAGSDSVEVEVNERYGRLQVYATVTKSRQFDSLALAEKWLKRSLGNPR